MRAFSGRFGGKTGSGRKLFTILFCVFSVFCGSLRRKRLPFNDKRRAEPSPKNHT
jgi:hypothetical protein